MPSNACGGKNYSQEKMEAMDFPPQIPGLSDLQDRNANDTSGTRILDLPEKCIINIIKHVPLQNMDDIIELFPKWDKIVQEHIPVEVHLTDIGFRIAHHYYMSHQDLPKYRVKIIHSRVLDETLPELKSPEDLEVVEFATHTEVSTFNTLVSKSVNLRELHFGYGSLSGTILSNIDFQLPNLKILSICDRPIEFRGSANILPSNVIGFLEKNFPSIVTLSVITSAPKNQTKKYVESLLKFIEAHSETLKTLKFNVMTAFQSLSEENESSQSSDVSDISTSECGINLDKLASVKLNRLELNFGHELFYGLEQWKALLQNQRNLIEVNMGSEKPLISSMYTVPVTQSAQSLASLHIGVDVFPGNEGDREPFDCSMLKNCDSLRDLTLWGPPLSGNETDRTPSSEIVNVSSIPQGLTSLRIENIYLETEQISTIISEHPNLKNVSLKNVGVSGAFGVTVPQLDSWIEAKKLKEIKIKGLNDENVDLSKFDNLVKFGMIKPLSKCKVNAIYFSTFKEYRKPRENVVQPSFF